MTPNTREDNVCRVFDAFCKKVLRNEARDYLDEMERRKSREIPLSELPVEAMEQLATYDSYFKDNAFHILGCTVYVEDAELAEAIAALPKDKQEIILLFHDKKNNHTFWCGYFFMDTVRTSHTRQK